MQQKRKSSFGWWGLVLVLVIAGAAGLMWLDVPAPVQQVEQELDAKTFLTAQP
jgi:hypothetical protein